ncbi:MAG: NAD(+)/NADH kinase [Halobacteriota archaeon]
MNVAVVYKHDSREIAQEVLEFLGDRVTSVKEFNYFSSELEDYDFIVSIGGDGTILSILQEVERCPPIFGVNTGRIGLLNHSEVDDFKDGLTDVLEGKLTTEEFLRIEGHVNGERLVAMNEIAVLSAIPAKLMGVVVKVDGVETERLRADGMLFSTPVGSTAYALSAGGPVVDPRVHSIIAVPIAPFKLGWRPWVISKDRIIEMELILGKAKVVADGRKSTELSENDTITIKKYDHPAVFFKMQSERIEKIVNRIRTIE